jgi:hypothetical protein
MYKCDCSLLQYLIKTLLELTDALNLCGSDSKHKNLLLIYKSEAFSSIVGEAVH